MSKKFEEKIDSKKIKSIAERIENSLYKIGLNTRVKEVNVEKTYVDYTVRLNIKNVTKDNIKNLFVGALREIKNTN